MLYEHAVESTTAVEEGKLVKAVYVYEAPLRLWHWVNALAITVLALSGYFIASPLPTQPGEASNSFLMGYIRFAHFAAGYVLAVGWLGRIYWAFAGNKHSQQLFMIPFWNAKWWGEVLWELRWYLFLEKHPKKYIGHNPLAQLSMFSIFTVGMFFMIATGFALYSEGTGLGSWADKVFGWVIPAFGGSQAVHSWHHLGMWVLVTFAIIHIYAAIREDIMSRQSMISTIISGWRMFKD
ncbi:MAG: Ni/Fe-hydrogenase, b-type cytochrome subunit [Rhodocyclaceae bacterium]|nr:Ni/Fe-hydrogenase, b-type cytochrome subunit [Rhodocyclaceae bacterium]